MSAYSMLNTVNDFARVNMHIGSRSNDAKWMDDQWASIPPETYTAMAEAIAEGDSAEAGHILEQAFSKLARAEAEHTHGVKL
jgi:hypothetical protein